MKSAQIRTFFWSEYGKILTRKTAYFDTFYTVEVSPTERHVQIVSINVYEEYQELKGDSTKEQVYDKIDQILFSFKNKRYKWQMKYNILEEETLRFV